MIKGKGLKGILVLSSFICMLLFISIELKAVEPQKTQKPEITEIEGIKLRDISVVKEPLRKIAPVGKSKIPHIKSSRADLTCTIQAFHDQQKTRPIQAGIWHMSFGYYKPPLILPWRIYYNVEVKNIGGAKAENFVVRVVFENPAAPMQNFLETVSLEPGEAVVLPYNWGPFAPFPNLFNKNVIVLSSADPAGKIEESDKNNNSCKFNVRFVSP